MYRFFAFSPSAVGFGIWDLGFGFSHGRSVDMGSGRSVHHSLRGRPLFAGVQDRQREGVVVGGIAAGIGASCGREEEC